MKILTITAARRRFGAMLDSAFHEPVLITRKKGKGAMLPTDAEQKQRMDRKIRERIERKLRRSGLVVKH